MTPTNRHTSVGLLTKTYIHQVLGQENLSSVMVDRDGLGEKFQGINKRLDDEDDALSIIINFIFLFSFLFDYSFLSAYLF